MLRPCRPSDDHTFLRPKVTPAASTCFVPRTQDPAGCYPCARRRINCDRTEPCCLKCTSRGLQCTGLALQILWPGPPSPQLSSPGSGHQVPEREYALPIPSLWLIFDLCKWFSRSVEVESLPGQSPRSDNYGATTCGPYTPDGQRYRSPSRSQTPSPRITSRNSIQSTIRPRYAPYGVYATPSDADSTDDAADSPTSDRHVSIVATRQIPVGMSNVVPAWKRQLCLHCW